MKRHQYVAGCVIVMSILFGFGGATNADTLSVAFDAEFEHPPQTGMFRTRLSSVTPVSFIADQTGGMTALFLPEPADCVGMIGWIAEGNESKAVGPAVLCIANGAVTEEQLNAGLDRGKTGVVDHRLVIRLGPSQPGDPVEGDQMPSQVRLNSGRVVAQIFLRGCDTKVFRKFGDLVFEQGTIAFTFWTDFQGRSQVRMSAAPVLLQELDGNTWNLIRLGCDVAQLMPSSPFDGQSVSFAGSSSRQPPDPSTLPGQFSLLIGQIDRLVYLQQLGTKDAQRLLKRLDRAAKGLQGADPDKALHELQKFRDDVIALRDRGVVDDAVAANLEKVELGIEAFLTRFVDLHLPTLDPVLYCSGNGAPCADTVSFCKFTSWYVDGASIDAAPDGSPNHPFTSITEALAEAAEMTLCGVTLHLAPARYTGPLEITRHTRVIGRVDPISTSTFPTTIVEGSVRNQGPFVLELSNVTLSWFHDEAANGVFVDHPCARTVLDNVAVVGYRGFGIRQRGGALVAQRTVVANTHAYPDSLFQGTGLVLSCGVQAVLRDVVLDSNESAGLLMAHPGTTVDALRLVVRNTRVHPSLRARGPAVAEASVNYGGAVQVRHQARLNATSVHISENWLAGIVVDMGAVAVVDYGTISHTMVVPLIPESPLLSNRGGVNAAAIREGHLMMSEFIVTRAEYCGLLATLRGEMDHRGTVTLTEAGPGRYRGADGRLHGYTSSSQVTRSVIGACIPEYISWYRLFDSVVYFDNDEKFAIEGSDFPVPVVSSPADEL
jgi:hypothetical protein